jgi:MFS transporter, ACS family, tartrate transporter
MILLVMGVTGSGKSTVGRLVAGCLAWVFLEADEFHTTANREKMRRGIPLTDADRLPWIETLRKELRKQNAAGKSVVLACSALKEQYRRRLSTGLDVRLVYLKGTRELIRDRLRARQGHFAGEAILEDQFATLEQPNDAIMIDVTEGVGQIVETILEQIRRVSPSAENCKPLLRKLRWRLLPFLFILYVVAYLDRINVGFAALQMKEQLGFSDTVYGFGAGIFFVGYFLFQVPSNLVLERFGARRWIATQMVVWGIISAAMLLVASVRSFFTLRFLLGAAEAGFFPGVIYYLRSWFPPSARAGVVALFMTAGPVSGIVGGPISGTLLQWDQRGGLAGWQWMFLLEAIPAILLGIVAYLFLSDGPQHARWLTPEEKDWLHQSLREDPREKNMPTADADTAWITGPNLWGFAFVYFGLNTCTYGISLWLPSALKSLAGLPNLLLGFLSAVPYLVATTLMVIVGIHSDRTAERRWHVALSAFAGSFALIAAGFSTSLSVSVGAFAIALAASSSMAGPFWAMASGTLAVSTAARGIALINAIGNLGGGFGPYWIGYLHSATGNFRAGLLSGALLLALSGFTVLFLQRTSTRKFVKQGW